MTTNRQRRALAAAALCVAGAAACSEPRPSSGPFTRLEVALEQAGGGGRAGPRVTRQLRVGRLADDWPVDPESVRHRVRAGPVDGEDGRHLLFPGPAADVFVTVPGPFDPRSFDLVRVQVLTGKRTSVALELTRDGEPVVASEVQDVRPAPDPQVFELEVNRARSEREPFDGIRLHFTPVNDPLSLLSIALVQRPPELQLPSLADGAELIPCRGDARRGVGLAAGRELTATFEVPRDGVLDVSCAWPPEVARDDQTLRFVAVVEPEGAEAVTRTIDMGSANGAGTPWRTQRIDLSRSTGRRARLTLTLESSDERPAACAVATPIVSSRVRRPPAVLLVTSDTHRADHLGAARAGVEIATPALDRLSRRGVLFESCYASTNVTNPSHVALMTATHPRDTGVLDNRTIVGADARTLAELFRELGWATYAVVSSNHLGDPASGLGQGFERMAWPETPLVPANVSVRRLNAWMASAADAPLFAWLHLVDAHAPYKPAPPYDRLYYPANRDPNDPSIEAGTFPVPSNMEPVRDIDWMYAQYKGEVTLLDGELARILEHERFRKGIVAFTSDHGECMVRNGIYWSHTGLYPDTVHVPLVLAGPGVPRGVRIRQRVFQLDLSRTLLDLAGYEAVEFPGRDLLAALDPDYRSEPVFTIAAFGRQASVTIGPWHLILSIEAGFRDVYEKQGSFERHAVELYDLDADPECAHDLAHQEIERARAMRRILIEWLNSRDERGWGTAADLDEEKLRESL